MLYRFILFVFGVAADVFYRSTVVEGEVPKNGPIIVVSNHPNALADPIFVARAAKRPLRYLAKEPLFRMPIIKWLVRSMLCLPVYRSKDGHSTDKNAGTFRAVFDALEAREAVALFPEGIGNNKTHLHLPFKTGAARMALEVEASHGFSLGVRIVPVGMFYDDKPIFRSRLSLWIDEPVPVAPFAAQYEDDPKAAVAALTRVIEEKILAITVNLENVEAVSLLKMAERIWPQDDVPRAERLRLMAQVRERLEHAAPERLARLQEKLRSLNVQLSELGLKPSALKEPSAAATVAFVLRNVLALSVGLVVAVVGTLAYFVPFLIARSLPPLIKADMEPDVLATARLFTGIVAFPLWQLALSLAVNYLLGWQLALPLLMMLPLCGFYAYRYTQRRAVALRRAGFALGAPKQVRVGLAALHDNIVAELKALHTLDAKRVPLE